VEIIKNLKIKKLDNKNSKSRKYMYSHKISRKALHHFTASQNLMLECFHLSLTAVSLYDDE